MSTFDPLSWLTPSIMVMNIFLQEPWGKVESEIRKCQTKKSLCAVL